MSAAKMVIALLAISVTAVGALRVYRRPTRLSAGSALIVLGLILLIGDIKYG